MEKYFQSEPRYQGSATGSLGDFVDEFTLAIPSTTRKFTSMNGRFSTLEDTIGTHAISTSSAQRGYSA